jgi:hypothetical protein
MRSCIGSGAPGETLYIDDPLGQALADRLLGFGRPNDKERVRFCVGIGADDRRIVRPPIADRELFGRLDGDDLPLKVELEPPQLVVEDARRRLGSGLCGGRAILADLTTLLCAGQPARDRQNKKCQAEACWNVSNVKPLANRRWPPPVL